MKLYGIVVKDVSFRTRLPLVHILTLSLISCMTLGKSFDLYVP